VAVASALAPKSLLTSLTSSGDGTGRDGNGRHSPELGKVCSFATLHTNTIYVYTAKLLIQAGSQIEAGSPNTV